LFSLKKYADAISAFEKAIECNPTEVNLWAGLALCHAQLGQKEKTEEALKYLEPHNPKQAARLAKSCDAILKQKSEKGASPQSAPQVK
jgi:Flp pilus assembly protein TadD